MPTASESIAAYAAAQTAADDANDAAIAQLVTDFQALNDLITQLQNNPGQITPADQAILDNLQGRAQTFSQSLSALAAANQPK